MKYHQQFSLSFYLNAGRREDRRRRMQNLLLDHGLKEVRRFPAVDPRRVKKLRGYQDAESYACALTLRLALRAAHQRRAASVMLFHDDVVLHPQFNRLLGKLRLPDDWGVFLLGAEHVEAPEAGPAGTVKCRAALGCHALAVKFPYYRRVMSALGSRHSPGRASSGVVSFRLAGLQREIPSYAALPNLVWPVRVGGGMVPAGLAGFDEDGWQLGGRAAVLAAVRQSLGIKPWWEVREKPPVPDGTGKAAFLFLTKGAPNHPGIWEKYFQACPDRVSIHGHPKERDASAPAWFREAWLPKSIATAWGDISLVKAQLALLKSAYRDPANQVFVFASDSCVPVKPLRTFLDLCESGGWRGMIKLEKAEEVVRYDVSKAKRYTAVPQVPPWVWKLHSQWIVLNREMVQAVLEQDLTGLFAASFAPDESYFGTVLALKGYPLEQKCLPLESTWVSWESQPSRHPKEVVQVSDVEALSFRLGGHCFARKVSIRSDIEKWGLHLG